MVSSIILIQKKSRTYIFHMYTQNEIVMDWDQPYDSLSGQTPFEVSIFSGFAQHQSQLDSFMWYYYGYTKASQLPLFNPCYYGLYRTTVGNDQQKNDMFENVTTHGELDRIAEEKRLAEEARLRAEEEARLKAEEEARLQAEAEAAAIVEGTKRTQIDYRTAVEAILREYELSHSKRG